MHVLDESIVLDSEIDSLGHMNVRFYMSRIDRASRKLLAELGLEAPSGSVLRRYDTYSRVRREQFAAAELAVVGGVLEVTEQGVRSYFEVRNSTKDELAASFITVTTIVDTSIQKQVPISQALIEKENEEHRLQLPKHAKPRSLTLEAPRVDVSLTELEQRVSDEPTPGMMSGRREARVDADACDAQGRLNENVDLMFVLYRPQPGEEIQKFGPPVMKTSEGHRFSWVMIETRAVALGKPRVGDQLVSIGADIALGERWRQSRSLGLHSRQR